MIIREWAISVVVNNFEWMGDIIYRSCYRAFENGMEVMERVLEKGWCILLYIDDM